MALLGLVAYTGLRLGPPVSARLFGQRSGSRGFRTMTADVITAPAGRRQPGRERRGPSGKEEKIAPVRTGGRSPGGAVLGRSPRRAVFSSTCSCASRARFTVLPEENADVRAGVEGIIEEIRVHEGRPGQSRRR